MAATAVASLLAMPGIVQAVSPRATARDRLFNGFTAFTPAEVDPRLAASLRVRPVAAPAQFRFTPVGVEAGNGRTITVAVRSRASAGAVAFRSVPIQPGAGKGIALAPTSYSLGTARGWQSFALPAKGFAAKGFAATARTPLALAAGDVSGFRIEDERPAKPSRIATRIALDPRQNVAAPAAAPVPGSDYGLDLGGSYRLTRGVDVTAGVRYNSDRLPAAPLTDARQDSQAVYVGTLIRF